MSICKYCGNETGGSAFCQNCGAKVEEPLAPQPVPQPVPMMDQQIPQQVPYSSPTQPSFYTPGGAGGLMAGNILVLIFSVICCCLIVTLASIAVSIIGIVYASKVKRALNEREEKSFRRVSLIMLLVGIGIIVLGIALLIIGIFNEYGSFDAFIDAIKESYESWSESYEAKHGFAALFSRFIR